jgi:hypothetical protein
MALKHENDEFFVMPLKRVLSVMGLVNDPETQKMWAIADENGYTCKNDNFFCHSSIEFRECYIPCKSPWNAKTMGNSP